MYKRTLEKVIEKLNKSFPVILITGPRQVGKTTLLEMCSKRKRNYITLDDLDVRKLAQTDPGLFLQTYCPPITIDEIQYAPQLLSYIKIIVDREKKKGLFWLTGSQKFHLMKGITESLAGRIAIIDLLGLSQAEITNRADTTIPFIPVNNWVDKMRIDFCPSIIDIYRRIWLGSFPVINSEENYPRDIFYSSYIQTYIQRDIKDILKITDENLFYNFLIAIAARTGQILNYNDLSRDIGVSNKTIKAWVSVLQASGILYLLYPYYSNITKRIVKTPKIYFLDTGLCAYLTRWTSPEVLESGAMSGAILETFIFSEILKSYWHNGIQPHFYYYRDFDQKEVDLLIESGGILYPVEFKKTATPSLNSKRNFHLLRNLDKKIGQGAIICFVKSVIPISKDIIAIPIGYL